MTIYRVNMNGTILPSSGSQHCYKGGDKGDHGQPIENPRNLNQDELSIEGYPKDIEV